jgi:hypothetical protein
MTNLVTFKEYVKGRAPYTVKAETYVDLLIK